jgi:GNAT superfamily N-acetyltransferase
VSLAVRPARRADAALIHRLILELAEYERLASEARASQSDIEALLFCPSPRAFCDIAEAGGEPIGFALWFYNLSTFEGRHGIFLEDLYVRPHARGKGAGRALMRALAQRCLREELPRLEWTVLDWNAQAIAVYDRLGAETKDEWVRRRLSGEALEKLADL